MRKSVYARVCVASLCMWMCADVAVTTGLYLAEEGLYFVLKMKDNESAFVFWWKLPKDG